MKSASDSKPIALIIDDEVQIRRLLHVCLEATGYIVLESLTGQDGINQAAQHRPDVVILDLSLPDMNGVDVLKRLREWSRVPVVVLSVCDREEVKIAALDNGADDFMTKPFGCGELLARLRLAQRHAVPLPGDPLFQSGDLEIDFVARVVKFKGREIKLTATEYSLVKMFVQHAGRVLTHRQILREVWGPSHVEQTHYLRVYMAHLREKLEAKPAEPSRFLTEPGVGYRLVAEA